MINEIIRYFPSLINGNPQHFFILSKNPSASLISDIAGKNYSMITVKIRNDGIRSVDQLVVQIIDSILNSTDCENMEFKPSKTELSDLKDNFAFYLSDIVNQIKYLDALIIIIDDIGALSDTPEFANWYKSFADTMTTSIENAPIAMILTGTPENFAKLYGHNPSFTRIFHVHELSGLSDDKINSVYASIFSNNDLKK